MKPHWRPYFSIFSSPYFINFYVCCRNEYFQELLNKTTVAVLIGIIHPLQGAQIVHGCATILGLPLLKELPGTTLIIQGMRKTNDLAKGRQVILKAFTPFGAIEDAAIAPNNRGFGM